MNAKDIEADDSAEIEPTDHVLPSAALSVVIGGFVPRYAFHDRND